MCAGDGGICASRCASLLGDQRHNTFDDILSVMTWSLRQAARGRFPYVSAITATPWTAEDVYRKSLRGRIGCSALLCQITGELEDVQRHLLVFPAQREKGMLLQVRGDTRWHSEHWVISPLKTSALGSLGRTPAFATARFASVASF